MRIVFSLYPIVVPLVEYETLVYCTVTVGAQLTTGVLVRAVLFINP